MHVIVCEMNAEDILCYDVARTFPASRWRKLVYFGMDIYKLLVPRGNVTAKFCCMQMLSDGILHSLVSRMIRCVLMHF